MAAGLGFKTFTTGEVLTAADTNGYLMQGINVFASTAARDAAITSPQEGQFAFTKDTNGLWYYDGAAWVASGATGDIEGVTAGVGITGGGTSGTVTITNDMATTITAAGDIVVGTGSGTYDNLPIGTTAQVLTADTTVSPYKVKWATPAAASSGMTKVTSGTFTNVASVSVNNCFTGTYTNYLLMYRHSGNGGNSQCSFKYRNGGVDTSTGYYSGFVGINDAGTTANLNTSNGTSVTLTLADTGEGAAGNFYFYQPAISGSKWCTGQFANNGQSNWRSGGFQRSQTTGTFDGFSLIFTTSNSTGTYTVYGLES
jgi:hypothetical protein